MKCPCKDCENKGCGSYHDECEKYQEFKDYNESVTQEKINISRTYKIYEPKKVYINKKKSISTNFKCHKKRRVIKEKE